MNRMRSIRIEKVTLNFGAGKEQDKVDKGLKLLEMISGTKPIKTLSKKRIPTWGIRPGLPIGCKVTLRKDKATDVLKRVLMAKENKLNSKNFDKEGNLSFGVNEYLEIGGVKYDPDIGIIGLQVCVTLERPGFRIRRRRLLKRKMSKRHAITQQEAIEFMKKEFKVEVVE